MAGHVVTEYLKQRPGYEVHFTSRENGGIKLDAADSLAIKELLKELKPEVIVNCIGVLNEKAANDVLNALKINSLLPHLLVESAGEYGGKVIHISTDCVFSGGKGSYTEGDHPDGTSVYAKTKSLGEISMHPHLTIRTSIIGPELKPDGIGLFHWFMKQAGVIQGYQNVYWNGVTTLELAKVIDEAIHQNLAGLYHLTAPSVISKHDLLHLFQFYFNKKDVAIVPFQGERLDRTLKNTRRDFTYQVPDYPEMLKELAEWMHVNG